MGAILIVEKDIVTVESLELILDALDQPYKSAATRPNAVRIYSTELVDAIFLNPELSVVDVKALIDELESVDQRKARKRAPIIFIYSDDDVVQDLGLGEVPRSQLLAKPVNLERLYEVLHGLGLTKLKMPLGSQQVAGRIKYFKQFVIQSEAWLEELKVRLVKA